MTIIIGVDPGSRRTGYGVIQVQGQRYFHLAHGCLDVAAHEMADRLRQIFIGLQTILHQYQPQEAAIEQIFMHENPNSALKLGQARGAAIVALASLPISEYAAREVKKSIVGQGAASKDQVQFMIKRLLNLTQTLQADASDALAIALCHAHARTIKQIIQRSK